jgi:hypothetical protein
MWRKDDEGDISSYWMTIEESRGYWRLKAEALSRTAWKSRFGRDCGPVVRQMAKCMSVRNTKHA